MPRAAVRDTVSTSLSSDARTSASGAYHIAASSDSSRTSGMERVRTFLRWTAIATSSRVQESEAMAGTLRRRVNGSPGRQDAALLGLLGEVDLLEQLESLLVARDELDRRLAHLDDVDLFLDSAGNGRSDGHVEAGSCTGGVAGGCGESGPLRRPEHSYRRRPRCFSARPSPIAAIASRHTFRSSCWRRASSVGHGRSTMLSTLR